MVDMAQPLPNSVSWVEELAELVPQRRGWLLPSISSGVLGGLVNPRSASNPYMKW